MLDDVASEEEDARATTRSFVVFPTPPRSDADDVRARGARAARTAGRAAAARVDASARAPATRATGETTVVIVERGGGPRERDFQDAGERRRFSRWEIGRSDSSA
jgi:hypothetical protein